jgi:bifunctional DNA primase/polymerase-like protein
VKENISESAKGFKSTREWAKAYQDRGWKPIPAKRGERNPTIKGWQTTDFPLEEFSAVKKTPQNICVQMGKPSKGLTDVDLDCPTARTLAPDFLPKTGAIFGRESSEGSHWLYYTELWKTAKHAVEPFKHPDKEKVKGKNDHGVVLVELRTGRIDKGGEVKGAVSMFPGSEHHSGELVEWSKDGEPASVDGAELRAKVRELAAAILLVDHYPTSDRHWAALALGGALARAEYEQGKIEAFVEAVSYHAGDEEWEQRVNDVHDKAERWAEGEPTQGRPKLREYWGDKVGDQIADWLGVQGSPAHVRGDVGGGEEEGIISELAGLEPIIYDRVRKEVADKLDVRLGTLDEMVRKRRKELARVAAAETPPPDIMALEDSARDIINDTDVLARFGEDFRKVIAGEQNTGKLLYLVATSRLFDKAMHAAVKGPSSGGKSEIRTRVLDFFPPEHVISFTALSERALLYMPVDFAHKVLSMGEAITDEETKFQDYLLRELMSEGKLRYPVVQKVHGELTTVIIERDGPVSFLVTTTRNKLNPENETRMLSLEIDDSEAQTKAVLRKVAASSF